MNLTISVDPAVLERARQTATAQGTSVQALLRRYLESLAGQKPPEQIADELLALMRDHPGHSRGARIRREDAYEGRT